MKIIQLLAFLFCVVLSRGEIVIKQPAFALKNVKDFGAVGNKIADDTTAFQSAINYASLSGSNCVIVPPGNYKTSQLNVSNNLSIVGIGKPLVTLNPGAGTLFKGQNLTNVTLSGLRMSGNDLRDYMSVSANGTRNGIWLGGQAKVINCDIFGFDLYAIYTVSQYATSPLFDTMQVFDCNIVSNRVGILYAEEYARISNCKITRTREAISTIHGNMNVTGTQILYAYYGLQLPPGSANNGHGNFVGGQLNHSTFPLFANGLIYGFNVVGSQMMGGGSIWITNCNGVNIRSCQLDPDNIYVSGGAAQGINYINNNWFADNSVTLNTNYGSVPGYVVFSGNAGFTAPNNIAMATVSVGSSPFTWANTNGIPVSVILGSATIGTVTDVSLNSSSISGTMAAPLTVAMMPRDTIVITHSAAPSMIWKGQ